MLLGASSLSCRRSGFLGRLLRDTAGNTLMLVAAALFPLLAMVGGGLDMSRGYLSQSRLQQACDSGVLAARKRLGTDAAVTGEIPREAALAGHRFFNLNFGDGAYGTVDRTFEMTLESDYSISGTASVNVPTTLMFVFGHSAMPVSVECQAQLDMANTDVMMVLDVTLSMTQVNPGDTVPRIQALKTTVESFYDQLTAAANAGTRLRFGFVPYSSNVNVGHLLQDDWVNGQWSYQSRSVKRDGDEDDEDDDEGKKDAKPAATPPAGPLALPSPPRWHYREIKRDVSKWRTETRGCIEERATYQIDDYANVDLKRAPDLDIDLVPTSDKKTRWAPMYPEVVYARSMRYNGTGTFTKSPQVTTNEYVSPMIMGLASCPAAARKLATMTRTDLSTYLATLVPTGPTYHDIGMIWGARLISPTGLFAAENADPERGMPSSRHMIFLTDGETAPRDIAYSSYGLEPLDQRRWRPGSPFTLTQTVERRFSYVCEQVKRKNVTVWVIAFGTASNPALEACAGPGRHFVADDAEQLAETFATIARRMGDLRMTR